MKVTRVIFEKGECKKGRPLAVCSIILDDCLRLNYIRLFKGESGYYLILPSKQDIYQDVQSLNEDIDIKVPKNQLKSTVSEKKKYEEFFHPVGCTFYKTLLAVVLDGYSLFREEGIETYRPKDK